MYKHSDILSANYIGVLFNGELITMGIALAILSTSRQALVLLVSVKDYI